MRRLGYPALLTVASLYVLAIFVQPTELHAGLNDYDRARFGEMVDGTAYRPFVYRMLLPTTVRMISSLAPSGLRTAVSDLVERHRLSRRLFEKLRWEIPDAHRYVVATLLMFLCFVGFAHFAASLTLLTCGIPETPWARSLLALAALMGVPALFRYSSFPYDPPQLFLFTAALYCLARSKLEIFWLLFVLCCLNKETAVLLIPIFALTQRGRYSRGRYVGILSALIACYVVVKSLITFAFRANPGTFVEFHFARNIYWLTRGWTHTDAVVFMIILTLLSWAWRAKPRFLKVSFLVTLPPLVGLALFLGYLDEWRGYYEAYPAALGLITDSARRFSAGVRSKQLT